MDLSAILACQTLGRDLCPFHLQPSPELALASGRAEHTALGRLSESSTSNSPCPFSQHVTVIRLSLLPPSWPLLLYYYRVHLELSLLHVLTRAADLVLDQECIRTWTVLVKWQMAPKLAVAVAFLWMSRYAALALPSLSTSSVILV